MHSHCTVQITCFLWLKSRIVRPEDVIHPRVMFHLAPRCTLNTCTSSLSPASPVLLSSPTPNPDLLSPIPLFQRQECSSLEHKSSTGYDPNRIELNRILVDRQNHIIDDQEDVEKIGVKPLSYNQSLTHSAHDSAESIATPPDSDLEDDHNSITFSCWLHRCKKRRREEMKDKLLKDWNWRTAHHGYIETRREQVRLHEELSLKVKIASTNSDPKCARNGRNEESSRTFEQTKSQRKN